MPKLSLIAVVEPDPGLRGLLERVLARGAPGIPTRFSDALGAEDPPASLLIYDLSAGWAEIVEWRRRHPRRRLVLLLGTATGLEQSSIGALRPLASFALPFPYSAVEDFLRRLTAPIRRRPGSRVISCRVAG